MTAGTRAVVVGAGIVGAAIAAELARAGLAVEVLEEREPGAGATGATFARLSAFDKEPHAYFLLSHAGITEHGRLAERLGSAGWLDLCGSFLWAEQPAGSALAERAERFRSWGYPLEWTDARELAAALGRPVRLPDPVGPVLHAPAEGWVDALALTRRLLEDAARHGARVRTGTPAVDLSPKDGGGWSVRLASSERVAGDVVVNAAGAGAARLAACAGAALDLLPSRGLLLEVAYGAAFGERFPHILHSAGVSIRPDRPGRVMIRSQAVDQRFAEEPDPASPAALDELARDLLGRAAAVVPALGAATVVSRRVGRRVLPRGGYPSVGGLGEQPGYYQAATHSGIILAPLVGRLLAEEITTGTVHELLSPHRPAPGVTTAPGGRLRPAGPGTGP